MPKQLAHAAHPVRTNKRLSRTGFLFVLPGLIGFAAFVLVPILFDVYYSAFDTGNNFAVIANFKGLFASQSFLIALRNTALFVVIGGALLLFLALLLAHVIYNLIAKNIKGVNAVQSAMVLPLVIPAGVIALFTQILFSRYGAVNGLFGMSTDWLNTVPNAFIILLVIYIWKNIGYIMIVFIAALSGMDRQVVEAAQCDGADAWTTFFKIELPLMVPALFFGFIMSVIGVFKLNRESFLLFGDYPNNSVYMLPNFITNNLENAYFSRAASAALVFLVLMAALVVGFLVVLRKAGDGER